MEYNVNYNMNSDGGSNNGRSPPPPPPPPFCCKCKCHNSRVASFPPGYKFNPTDEELVVDYLKKKVMNEPLPYKETMRTKIVEVNLYSHNPEDLAEQYNTGSGEREWYFFTPRERKYRNGNRPNRAAGDGYWKATGADKEISSSDDGVIVGYRKALVFYKGKPSRGDKTSWIMHEFRFNAPARKRLFLHDMTLDDWVLCRIYKKIDSNKPKSKKEEEATQTDATGKQLEEAAASDENQIHEGGIDDDHDQEVTAPVDTVERYMSKDQEQPRQPALPTNPYGMCQTPPVPPFQDGSKANYQFIHGAQDQHYNISGNEIKYGFQQPPPPPPMMVPRPSMFPQMGPNSNLMFRAEQLIPQYAIDSKPGGLVVPKQHPQQQPQQYHDENEDMDSLQIQVYLEDVENLYLEALDRFNSYFPKENNDKSPDGAHGPSFNQEFGS